MSETVEELYKITIEASSLKIECWPPPPSGKFERPRMTVFINDDGNIHATHESCTSKEALQWMEYLLGKFRFFNKH